MNGRNLFKLLGSSRPVMSPGCFDALSALLVQQAGFPCVSISGPAYTAETLGKPDLGFSNLDDMVLLVERITSVVDIPVLVDCDSGYGNAITATNAMQRLQKAGAACVCFQDENKFTGEIETASRMCGLLEAVAAVKDDDTLLMARTDSYGKYGIDDALERASRYRDSGADVLFIDGVKPEDFSKLKEVFIDVPLKYNNAIKKDGFQYSAQELGAFGFSLIAYSSSLQKVAIKSMQGVLAELLATGKTAGWLDKAVTQSERNSIVGHGKWKEMSEKYIRG